MVIMLMSNLQCINKIFISQKDKDGKKRLEKMFQQAKQRFKMSEEGVSFIDMIETFKLLE